MLLAGGHDRRSRPRGRGHPGGDDGGGRRGRAVVGVVRLPHPAAIGPPFRGGSRGPANVRASGTATGSAAAVGHSRRRDQCPCRRRGGRDHVRGACRRTGRPSRRRRPRNPAHPGRRPCAGRRHRRRASPATACPSTTARRPAACSSPAMPRTSCRSSSPATPSAPLGFVAVADGAALVRVDDPVGLVRLGDLGEALPLDPGAPLVHRSSPAPRPCPRLQPLTPHEPVGPSPAVLVGSGTATGSGPLMAGVRPGPGGVERLGMLRRGSSSPGSRPPPVANRGTARGARGSPQRDPGGGSDLGADGRRRPGSDPAGGHRGGGARPDHA